ncbi:MAG: DUF3486 family protein [Candidatus Subteraquimicrobiales bacterium]|nr:DUF3486 family protein [Candidatus Subteraquimicrobiales bacterium]
MGGPHTKTRRHSKVETELPAEIKTQVDRLLIENATYEEIAEFLKTKGHDISKSSIGRYGKEFLNAYKRLRMIEDQSRTLVSEAGSGMVLEEAASKIFSQQIIESLLEAGAEPKNLPKLAMAFSMLQSSSVSREKFKSDIKKKTEKIFDKAEKNLKKMSKEELIKTLREDVYGLA